MSEQLDPSDGREPELKAPDRLVAALRALHAVERSPRVPAEIDASILAAARAHVGALAKPERATEADTRRPIVLIPGWLAMAAGLVLGVGLMFLLSRTEMPRTPVAWARGDLDGNGRLDMLDAFALARRLQGGGPTAEGGRDPGLDPGLDFNGDGVVDGKDVDWLAVEAVRLRKG